jgi:hypothetical protein
MPKIEIHVRIIQCRGRQKTLLLLKRMSVKIHSQNGGFREMTELERMELQFEWYGEEGETLAYKTARNIDIGDTISLEPAIPRIDIESDGAGVTVKGLRIIISSQPEYKPSPPFKLSDKVIQLAREHYNKVAPYIGMHFSRMDG